jgi:hypothetical protein
MWNISMDCADPATWDSSLDAVLAAPENRTVIHEDDAVRVISVSIALGAIENPHRRRLPSVFVVGFYEVLSAASIKSMSATLAHDPDVTTLRETSADVAIGWPSALESWNDAPVESFVTLSRVMTRVAIKVHRSIAHVAGLQQAHGKMKDGESFAFSALGINICEEQGDKWLIVHHHEQGRPAYDKVRVAKGPLAFEMAPSDSSY